MVSKEKIQEPALGWKIATVLMNFLGALCVACSGIIYSNNVELNHRVEKLSTEVALLTQSMRMLQPAMLRDKVIMIEWMHSSVPHTHKNGSIINLGKQEGKNNSQNMY